MGVVRLRGCPYAPFVLPPHTFGHPHMFRNFHRVFNLIYHKMFSYFRGRCGGLSYLGGVQMLPMYICPLHVWMPPYAWNPLYVWIPHMLGCPPVCLDTPICLDTPLV